ncbi:DUF262 domain-containing protein [Heyndrickxia oleronia]|uniref:DUF262 domain-containing protein n=1 Tax=Heyndrickxia oleronia TaxID=38875 RepID=A0A8E2IA21_9BACI|nr:DUF262 domain-containing protein [Heyndrickxia oleronia]MEC1375029.1 DUF262 domain-containing protein [Heyndrickxia oleronia]OOP68730.1 hypothetical protein BWZ43_09070 [Heyndrickxia oleronia]QQZ04542.1 DUF262 domain-containing protein [Heyndrickxia oleronia]
MALLQDELKIKKIRELLKMKLALPSYQRPYSWGVKSTNTLFLDTFNAYQEGVQEYRIGSVILHKDNGRYNVVDGQQRLTTLSILLYCLGYEDQGLLREKYNQLSNDAIVTNFSILSKRINELSEDVQSKYKEYLLEHCSAVQIVTDSEQEAFQFFDSQNSRGKELKPHDLLKSYHLREMNSEDENQKVKIINSWENINQDNLEDLFKIYLYPLTQWYKGKEGLGYSSSKIDSFKGIKGANIYNYAIYQKASNLYVEQFNTNGSNELLSSKLLNQFQLTQPLIAGKRFFNYTLHYGKLLEKIQKLISHFHDHDQIPSKRSGDIYIKQLYECSLLFFADRFGFESLTQSVMQQLYSWSYSLRLAMTAVYPQTINKYAKGLHERANFGIDMFSAISEMEDPEGLKLLALKQPDIDDNNQEKYKAVYELLCEWNGW